MPKSKVSAFFSVLLVFASGVAMGAVGYRLYVVKTVTSSTGQPGNKKKEMSPEDYRKRVLAHLKDAVKLSDQQVEQVQQIYDWQGEQFTPVKKKSDAEIDQVKHEFDQQLHQIHEAAVAKIKAMLTADQQPLYDKWLADRAAARAADHKKHQQQQGPGPHSDGHRPPPLP
jgi:uncharacterized membrane-anchored protein YhcB (DUF1043 family)